MGEINSKSPFEYSGGNLALDFTNTVNNRVSGERKELLTDYSRLLQWGEESGAITKKTSERLQELSTEAPGHAISALRHSVQVREAIYDIFCALAERRVVPATALAILNKATHHVAQHGEIVHANRRFAWEWKSPETNLDAVLWPVVRAAADLLTSENVAVVRQCAADDCAWLFLDTTKNHRRRWCDMKICGNRDKARRYYQRQKMG